jgi:hypothetical protein
MPALPDVAKVVKIAAIWSDGVNTDIVTRWYEQYTGSAPSSTQLNSFCSDVHADIQGDFSYATSDALTLGRVHAIDLSSPTGAEGDWLGAVAGTNTDPPNALDVAQVVSYEIARRYRGGHPRGYWPLGSAAALSTPQRWEPTYLASIQSNMEDFFGGLPGHVWSGGGTLQHVNVSYFSGFTVVTDPITGRARNVPTVRGTPLVDAVTAYVARAHIGTQRRRLQY